MLKNIHLIMFIIFLTGLWFPKVGIPLLAVIIIYLIIVNRVNFTKLFLINYILIFIFIVLYILFWNDPSIPIYKSYYKNKELYMLGELLIVTSAIYWIPMFILDKVSLIYVLYIFSFGMYLKALMITLNTLINAPYLLGLRLVLDPFAMKISNSPAISLMAVYGTLFSLYYLFVSSKKFALFHSAIILIGLFIAVLLQARAFFVIFAVFLVYLLIIKLNFKNLMKSFFIAPFLILIFFFSNEYMLENSQYYASTQENILKRFNKEGVESNRYKQWNSAYEIILNHPFGGGSTDKSIERTYWFHNLWLDIGRTSGILPLILMLIFQFIVIFALIKNLYISPTFEKHFLFIFYIALLIGLFIEIALEGNIVLFVFYIFFSALIMRYIQIDNDRRLQ